MYTTPAPGLAIAAHSFDSMSELIALQLPDEPIGALEFRSSGALPSYRFVVANHVAPRLENDGLGLVLLLAGELGVAGANVEGPPSAVCPFVKCGAKVSGHL